MLFYKDIVNGTKNVRAKCKYRHYLQAAFVFHCVKFFDSSGVIVYAMFNNVFTKNRLVHNKVRLFGISVI